jgi:hypothetical protein
MQFLHRYRVVSYMQRRRYRRGQEAYATPVYSLAPSSPQFFEGSNVNK